MFNIYSEKKEALKDEVKELSEVCTIMENKEIKKNETEELKNKKLELNKQLEGVKTSQHTLKSNDKIENTALNYPNREYCTGLPNYSTLLSIFYLAFPNPHDDKASLTSFQQLCVVLMKLRLCLGD